ncbi:MAG: hypothetical protein QM639_16730 [Rhodocyclaceae bacterium]|jgi:hypothetical protein
MKNQNLTDALLAELGLVDPVEQASQDKAEARSHESGTPADPLHESDARKHGVPPSSSHPLSDA